MYSSISRRIQVKVEEHEMKVRMGEPFEVSLDSNPTTGHSWEPSFDPHQLSLKDSVYTPSSILVGAGGRETFTFISLKRGNIDLKMRYRRPWENVAIEIIHMVIVSE
jgi:inhibitor of cysteine peptidase